MTLSDTRVPRWLLLTRRFLLTPQWLFSLLTLFLLATAFSFEVPGAAIAICLISVILVLSDDILATTGPFFFFTVLVSNCYDSFNVFIRFWPLAFPVLFALIFHFVYYRGLFRRGDSFVPLMAVSLSVTLGGVGCLSAAAYFNPAALYYVAGLGFGMVGLYLLMKSQLSRKRDYDARAFFLLILYLSALYAVFFVFRFYAMRLVWMQDDLKYFGHLRLISVDRRNIYATYLLMGLPAPFYYAQRSGRMLPLLPALFIYLSLLMSGSRGGLLMGTVLLVFCFVYLFRRDRAHRVRNGVLVGLLGAAGLLGAGFLARFYSFRFDGGFIKGDEPRVLLLRRAVGDFLSHPVFGVGLGYTGNADIYDPKKFAMNWYHMMIPQIVAGLGIAGILAYAFLFYRRVRLCRQNGDALSRVLALSYLGLFLMSQVNPGEFCPIPYEFSAVLIFLLLEEEREKEERESEKSAERAFLSLLSAGLFGTEPELPPGTDFSAVLTLSERQMVFGMVGDGMGKLPEDAVPEALLFDLQNKTLSLLRQNERLSAERAKLCGFLLKEKIPAAILKGDSVARYYPTPELRVAGDIDCLLHREDVSRVGDYLLSEGYVCSREENGHHIAYRRGRVEIELHFEPSGLPEGAVGNRLRTLLSDTVDTAVTAELNGCAFPVPDAFHQALILLLHMQQHMREGGLGLRQVSDFALFAAREWDGALSARLMPVLREVGLFRFAAAMCTLSVRYLGLPISPFGEAAESELADALFADFLESGNFGAGSDYAGSGVVTLHRKGEHGAFVTALSGVADKCREKHPAAVKHPVLLLFLVPAWILCRLFSGGRRVRPFAMLKSAGERGRVYDRLALFKEENAQDKKK